MKLWDENIELDKIALKDERQHLTYGDLINFGLEVKKVISQRCVVLLLCENSIEIVNICSALLQNDIVPIMMGNDAKKAMNEVIVNYRPAYVFANKKEKNVKELGYKLIWEVGDYNLYRTAYDVYDIFDELALLLLTSGSTGNAKCVRISRLNFQMSVRGHVNTFQLRNNSKYINTAEISHVLGLNILFSMLCVGATVYVSRYSILDSRWKEFVIKEQPNSFVVVPHTLEILIRIGLFQMLPDDYVYYSIICAGAKLRKDIVEQLSRGARNVLRIAYGQTEATGLVMACACLDFMDKKDGCIGKPDSNFVDVKINKDTQTLVVRGQSICLGYAENYLDLIKGNDNHYVLDTGDVVKVDGNGFYYLLGRANRILKIDGIRYNLNDIELKLQTAFKNLEIVVNCKENLILLYCVEDEEYKQNMLKEYLRINFGIPNKYMEETLIKEIPRTSSGKVQYSKL